MLDILSVPVEAFESCCPYEQVIRDIGRRVMEIQNAGLGEHKCVLVPSVIHTLEARTEQCHYAVAVHIRQLWPLHQSSCSAVVHCIKSGAAHRRLRDLNDEINKLIREKGHWERRIVELGGPDYAKSAPKVTVMPVARVSEVCHTMSCAPPRNIFEQQIPCPCAPHAHCCSLQIPALRAFCPLQVQDSEGKEIRDGVTGRGGGYRYFGAAKQLPGVRELFEKEPPRKVPFSVSYTAISCFHT